MPRLADCSSGKMVAGFPESGVATSVCACATAEQNNAAINMVDCRQRKPAGVMRRYPRNVFITQTVNTNTPDCHESNSRQLADTSVCVQTLSQPRKPLPL